MPSIPKSWFILCVAFCVLLTGCTRPLLYKPSFDRGHIVCLTITNQINSLGDFPRTKTQVQNGINLQTGERQQNQIKEMFDLVKGDANYRFVLCFDETAAALLYESDKQSISRRVTVFEELRTNGNICCVFNTEQPKGDPAGGGFPMGYYISQISFRIRNLYLHVTVRHPSKKTEKLNEALKELELLLLKLRTLDPEKANNSSAPPGASKGQPESADQNRH